jgi:cyclic-di-GMP-binding biofilm dispersal mediator protein
MIMHGRSVLVVGATGGLGSAIATSLAQRGAALTLVARDPQRLAALPVDGHRFAADLRDPAACEAAVARAVAHGGGLDVVVNAVGIVAFGTVDELSFDTVEDLFMTNTFVPIVLAQAALRSINE